METKIGEKMKITVDPRFHPESGHVGKVVWISEDEKTVALQCEKKHNGKVVALLVEIDLKK